MTKTALTPSLATLVARATVRLSRLGGQGVLVHGGLILTAAHCIGWTSKGAMAYGDAFLEPIVETSGRPLTVDVLAVEPRADIAVLGALDSQVYPEEADAFEAWCEETIPVRLYTKNLPPDTSPPPRGVPKRAWARLGPSVQSPAYVLTHNKGWIPARARQVRQDARALVVEVDERIEGGTSGGPVVTADGELLGMVSQSSETRDLVGGLTSLGPFPVSRPHRALPSWSVSMTRRVRKGARCRNAPGVVNDTPRAWPYHPLTTDGRQGGDGGYRQGRATDHRSARGAGRDVRPDQA